MSGDVQPRKRKDKKRKRDSLDHKVDGDVVFTRKQSLQEDEPREQHQGVHGSKMGNEDVHLHVQGDHETGGHWCAKLFFFALLAILLGLIGLIILENRGLADLDTPLSESRFSNYFDGWVDEHREAHEEHDAVTASIEEHEHGDEPFEEEEDHSEIDESDDGEHGDEEEEEKDHDDDEDEENEEDEEDQTDTKETEEDNDEDVEAETAEDDETQEQDEKDEEDEEEDDSENTVEETAEETKENDDEDAEDEEPNDENGNDDEEEEDEEEKEETNESIEPPPVRSHQTSQQASSAHSKSKEDDGDDDDDEPFEEEDDDGTFESLESVVVDNDAEELLLLQEKARQQQASATEKDEPEPEDEPSSYSSSQIKPRGGGPQAMDDDEFEEELKKANEEMLRENLNTALTLFESLSQKFPDKPEAFLGKAKLLDKLSEIHRSNSKLFEAIEAYKRYLAFDEDIRNDAEFLEVAQRCVDRMRFMGLNRQAIPIHEMLIERFPNEVSHRNQLAVTYLLMNRLSDAKHALEDTLARWPNDGFALVHYGFVLKNLDQNLQRAVEFLQRGIDSQAPGTEDGRFYFNLGDSLQRLGRLEEARQIYRRGATLKLFPSEYQRSLYNVDSLRAKPFWSKRDTRYEQFFDQIEKNWQIIRDEGLKALNARGTFENEAENLRDSGDWKQFELFARGQRRSKNCEKAAVTCGIIEMFPSARFCKRGQVKFSVMHPGTHVWPHCGPTNCRLRAHLGLKVPPGTHLRVGEDKRTWEEGKFLIFDDSFEHEVWHNGTSLRLVLIVDIWHPDLTEQQRQSLSPI